MRIIEAGAYRTWGLKVPVADYKGEERYRPNEEVQFHASVKASLETTDHPGAAMEELQTLVEAAVDRELADFKAKQHANKLQPPAPARVAMAAPSPASVARGHAPAPPAAPPAPAPAMGRPSVQQRQYLMDLVLKARALVPTIGPNDPFLVALADVEAHPPASAAAADMAINSLRDGLRNRGVRT